MCSFFNPKLRKKVVYNFAQHNNSTKSQDFYACSDLQMHNGNRYALLRSVDKHFEIHVSLLSVVFLLMFLFFLVSEIVN